MVDPSVEEMRRVDGIGRVGAGDGGARRGGSDCRRRGSLERELSFLVSEEPGVGQPPNRSASGDGKSGAIVILSCAYMCSKMRILWA